MSKIHFLSFLATAQLVYDVRNKTYLLARARKNGQNDEQVANIDAGDDENSLDQIHRSLQSGARTLSAQLSPYLRIEHEGGGTDTDPYKTDDALGRLRQNGVYTGQTTDDYEASDTLYFKAGEKFFSCLPTVDLASGSRLTYTEATGRVSYGNYAWSVTEVYSVPAGETCEVLEGYAAGFRVFLAMPSNYDSNLDGTVTEAVHDYLVYMACYDWYTLVKPDEAAQFTARATQAADFLRQALNKRVAPSL